VSLRPTSPRPLFIIALGLVLGLAVGLIDAVLDWRLLTFPWFARKGFVRSL
jgi:hypothetical protein